MVIANEEDFHPAVRLLLARMETDPEEFTGKGFRWQKTLQEVQTMCTDEERNVLSEKFRTIRMDALHVQAMKIITRVDDSEPDENDDMPDGAMGLSAKHHQQQQAKMQAQQMLAVQQAQQDKQMQHAMQQMGLGGYGHGYAGNQANQQSAIQQANAQDLARNLGLAGPGVPVRLMPSYEDVMAGSKPMGVMDSIKQFGLDLAGKPRK